MLREGVRLVQEREARHMALHALLKDAVNEADGGETIPMEKVFDELRAELAAMKDARRAR